MVLQSDPLPVLGRQPVLHPIPLTRCIGRRPHADTEATGILRHRHRARRTIARCMNCTSAESDGRLRAGQRQRRIFHLVRMRLRTAGWTRRRGRSADSAGPGALRRVMAGEIRHAIRFTVQRSQQGYIHPATHAAGTLQHHAAAHGELRMRLKASFDTSSSSGPSAGHSDGDEEVRHHSGPTMAATGTSAVSATKGGPTTWTTWCRTCIASTAATSRR